MNLTVHLVEDAELDLTEIARFIAERESMEKALSALAKIESL